MPSQEFKLYYLDCIIGANSIVVESSLFWVLLIISSTREDMMIFLFHHLCMGVNPLVSHLNIFINTHTTPPT